MDTVVMDGKAVADSVNADTAEEVARLVARGVTPGLAVILVGEDPASISYVNMKERDCERVGIRSLDARLPADTLAEDLFGLINEYNASPEVHGILVQLPLPAHIDPEAVLQRIDPSKDVDGLSPVSMGKLLRGLPGRRACTPLGVMRLLQAYEVPLEGARAVVVGRSALVGKPMALLLLEANASVTVCHSRTRDLPGVCREADVLVAAVGRPHMFTAEYVREGAVVIDVGITGTPEGLAGDVDFDSAATVASAITPVPGGIGPMTRAMLLSNTVEAAAATLG
jgi:methylenetetrahydrofolate dehydrogenase (NADP+)/methenyltetrahydrofolate cyclohydrolase